MAMFTQKAQRGVLKGPWRTLLYKDVTAPADQVACSERRHKHAQTQPNGSEHSGGDEVRAAGPKVAMGALVVETILLEGRAAYLQRMCGGSHAWREVGVRMRVWV